VTAIRNLSKQPLIRLLIIGELPVHSQQLTLDNWIIVKTSFRVGADEWNLVKRINSSIWNQSINRMVWHHADQCGIRQFSRWKSVFWVFALVKIKFRENQIIHRFIDVSPCDLSKCGRILASIFLIGSGSDANTLNCDENKSEIHPGQHSISWTNFSVGQWWSYSVCPDTVIGRLFLHWFVQISVWLYEGLESKIECLQMKRDFIRSTSKSRTIWEGDTEFWECQKGQSLWKTIDQNDETLTER
jgi:hypothetical protein